MTMPYVQLGPSDLTVSQVCLGTAFRGKQDEQTCLAVIEEAAALGCNFIDCANVYRDGRSEHTVGKAIKGRRDQFIVATKVGSGEDGNPDDIDLSRANIMRAVGRSLKRLETSYIDLYLCHRPDPHTPLQETLLAMADLVQQGKIRYPGCCNFEKKQLEEALAISEQCGCTPFVCNQVLYNLLDRHVEDEMLALCRTRNVAVTCFSPTAIGLLTGCYRHGQPPPVGTPWHEGPYNYHAAMTEHTDRVIRLLKNIADKQDKTPTQVAIAWCLGRVDCAIIGSDTRQMVKENFGAGGWLLPRSDLVRLDTICAGSHLIIQKDCPQGYVG